MTIKHFTLKHLVMDAMQYTGANFDEVAAFVGYEPVGYEGLKEGGLILTSPDGVVLTAYPGDWIVKNDDAYYTPYEEAQFVANFEEVTP